MSKKYPHIEAAIYGHPWAIREQMLDVICEVVESAIDNQAKDTTGMNNKPCAVDNINGVAVIPVVGVISKRMNMFSRISGGTSIDQLSCAFDAAMADKETKCVLFHFDSPGGSVSGLPEFASKIFEARQTSSKPIIALADGLCASAAYWMASQCDAVYTTEGSDVGSIGVIAKLVSDDRAQKNEGIDSTVIASHELKATGYGAGLTPNQEQLLRGHVMQLFDMFKGAVVRGRGKSVDIEAVATGRTWLGKDAVENGLCDGLSTFDKIISQFGGID